MGAGIVLRLAGAEYGRPLFLFRQHAAALISCAWATAKSR
jgi:hypothetical protein